MREGWEVSTIGDALHVNPKMGKLEDSAPFVTMADVDEWGKFAHPSGEKGSRGGIRAKGGDVLFARITPCLENGKIGKLPDAAPPTGGSTEFIVLRGSNKATSDFAFLLAQSSHVHSSAVALMTGSTGRQRVAASDVANIPINLPPIREQKRIVDLMDSVDAAVSAAQAEVAAVKRLRSSLLSGHFNVEDDLKEFRDVAVLRRGYDLPAKERVPGKVPVISSSGLHGTHAVAKVKSPGVVTGRSGTIGEVTFVEEDFWPLNTTLFVEDFKGNKPEYVAYLLESMELKSHAGGSTVPSLNRNVLDRVTVRSATSDEQISFVALMREVSEVVKHSEKGIDRLRGLRSSMLSVLLSGEHEIPASYDQFLDLSEAVRAG